jgi:ATP-dependent DNA helicase RecG
MAITSEQIDSWLNVESEDEQLEFKEAKTQFDFDRACEYCVALANEGGGHLILGVTDKKPRIVVGTKAFENLNSVKQRLLSTLNFRVEIHEIFHSAGRVLVLEIPSRLVGSAYHLHGSYLMRSGESVAALSEDRLRKIFAESARAPHWLEEHSIAGVSEDQVLELLDAPSFFQLLKIPFPTRPKAVLERLVQERLVDVRGKGFAIRRIGALLLARDFKTFPDLERKAPRVISYIGKSKISTQMDRTASRGYAVGFQGLLKFVTTHLPRRETFSEGLRQDLVDFPEVLIRELVANALIHQDLGITGMSVVIEIYGNRVEISSPGDPLVAVERLIDHSESRNERLAGFMRKFGICEEKGSGIDRVIRAAEGAQLPAPEFRAGLRKTTVVVFGPRSFDDMNREERIRGCYQHCALKWVMSETMTNESLRVRFGLNQRKSAIVSQVIAAAIEAGVVKLDERVGSSRKFARYVPIWA